MEIKQMGRQEAMDESEKQPLSANIFSQVLRELKELQKSLNDDTFPTRIFDSTLLRMWLLERRMERLAEDCSSGDIEHAE